MKVACKHCGATYEIKDERIPPGGMNMKCPKCLSSFRVNKEDSGAQGDVRSRTILGMGIKPGEDPDKVLGQLKMKPATASKTAEKKDKSPSGGPSGGGKQKSATPLVPPAPPSADSTEPASPKSAGAAARPVATTLQGMGSGGKEGEQKEKYYVKRYTGRVFGPFPVASIQKMMSEGKLEGNEEISSDQTHWETLSENKAFADSADSTATPPPDLPVSKKQESSEPELPALKKQRSSEPELPQLKKQKGSEPELPTLKKQRSSEPELPQLKKQKGSEPELPALKKQRSSEPELPQLKKQKGSEPELPTLKKQRSSEPELPQLKKQKGSEPELPTLKKQRSSEPELPQVKKQQGSEPELPAVKKQRSSEPELPQVKKQQGSEPELPAVKKQRSSEPELPTPKGADLPQAKGADLPQAKGADLPQAKGADLPQAKGADLPQAKGADLPQAKGADLPQAKGADLPQAKRSPPPVIGAGPKDGDLPTPKNEPQAQPDTTDLPTEKSGAAAAREGTGDLPTPKAGQEAATAQSGAEVDLSELDLVVAKAEEGATAAAAADAEQQRVSGARELDLGGSAAARQAPEGATPLDLDELDVVVPGQGAAAPAETLARPDEIEREGKKADSATADAGVPARPIQKAVGPSWVQKNKNLLLAVGGGAVLLVVIIVGLMWFMGREGKPASSKKRAPVKNVKKGARVLPIDEMWHDTPAAYRKVFEKALDVLKKNPNDPVVAASAAKVAYAFEYRYGVKPAGYKRAHKVFERVLSAQKKHPEIAKARALKALVANKPKRAAGRFAKQCAKGKKDVESCIYWGWASLARGYTKTGTKAFERALNGDKQNGAALFGLARCQLLGEQEEKGQSNLEKTLKFSPRHLEARLLSMLMTLKTSPPKAFDPQSTAGKKLHQKVERIVKRAKRAKVEKLKQMGATVAAAEARRRGETTAALAAAEAGAESDDPFALMEYGWLLHDCGRYKQCRDVFRKARRKAYMSIEAATGLARCLLGLDRGDAALGVVRKAWKKYPKSTRLRVLRGQVNLARGKPKSAKKYYTKALNLDPRHAPAYVAWIRLRIRDAKNLGGAHAQLEQLGVQGVKSPELVFLKGQIFEAQKRLAEATAQYEKAVSLHPGENRYRVAWGRALLNHGKLDLAKEVLQTVWERSKCTAGLARALAAYRLRSKDMEGAVRILKKGAEHRPTVAVKLALAQLYLQAGGKKRVAKAVVFLRKLIGKQRRDPEANKMLGRALLLQDKPKEAQKFLKNAVAYGKKDTEAKLLLARAYMAEAKVGRAMAELKEALKINPNDAAVLEYKAQIAFRRGAVVAALKDLKKAIAIAPQASAYTLKAQCLMERRKKRAALKALAVAMKLEPRYPKAQFVRGQILYRSGKLRGAIKSLRNALTFLEDRDAPWVVDTHYMLGRAFADLRDSRQARIHLKKYLELTKGDTARKSTRREVERKLRKLRMR